MLILGVDVGYRNLGLCTLRFDEETGETAIANRARRDITEYACGDPACPLGHTIHVADCVAHLLLDPVFHEADVVCIERQPPGGLCAVEALIYSSLRSKAILISPNAMHRHFQINHLDYEERKLAVLKISEITGIGRLHDIADAYCLAKFYSDKILKPKFRRDRAAIELEAFRYQ